MKSISDTDQAPYSAPATQPATASDAAVEAAVEGIQKVSLTGELISDEELAIAALTAALPYLALSSAPCSVEVEDLEWERSEAKFFNEKYFIGSYSDPLNTGCGNWHCILTGFGSVGYFHSIEVAKAAAQADFDRRILSQIVTKPVDEDAKLPCDVQLPGVLIKRGVSLSTLLLALERRKDWPEEDTRLTSKPVDVVAVREQCAAVAELHDGQPCGTAIAWSEDECQFYNAGQQDAAASIAAAIRALSPAEPAQQWQDIATAPRDGKQFLAALSNGWIVLLSEVETGRYTWYQTSSKIHIPVARTHHADSLKESILATHWMPLPAAPFSAGRTTEGGGA